jgi:hypothetical protein
MGHAHLVICMNQVFKRMGKSDWTNYYDTLKRKTPEGVKY